MSVLRANLKHLYQHRGLWLYYVLLALFVFQMFHFHPKNARLIWVWCVLINVMAGLAVGMLQREILSKPFSYCLPGHRPVPRRIIGAVGIVLNTGLSFLVLVHPEITAAEAPLIFLAAFSLGLAAYLLGARLMFTLSDKIVSFLGVETLFMMLLFAKASAVDDLILAWPEVVAAFGLAAGIGLWMDLHRGADARTFCGQAVQNLGDFSRASIERNQRVRRAAQASGSAIPLRVEAAFLDRIDASRPLSAARCVWADLYVTLAMLLSWAKWVLLLCVPAALVLAFVAGKVNPAGTDRFSMKFPGLCGVLSFQIVAFASLMLVFQTPVPVFSNMLLTRGRRERFKATMSIALALASFVSFLLVWVTLCTVLLQLIAPGTFGSFLRLFGGLCTAAFIAAPFALVPLGLATRLLARYREAIIVYFLLLCVPLLMLTVRHWFNWIAASLLASAAACSWLALVLAAHRICMRRSFTR